MQATINTFTAAAPFLSANSEQAMLFSVNPGVPALDALETTSCFLDDALKAMGNEENCCFAAHYLIQMSKAVVDSLLSGLVQGNHGTNTAPVGESIDALQAKNAILEASLKQADDEAARISKELQICSSFITCARVTVESENSFEGCDASVLLLDVQNRLDKAAGDLSHHGEVA